MRYYLSVLVLLLLPVVTLAAPPNIVLILGDDQGWNALSTQMDPNIPGSKSDFYQTPCLDKLCREGMRFAQAYSPATVCSPTRHSITFGVSPAKTRITYNNSNARQNCDPKIALPNLIKKANKHYVTATFGKWHISFPPKLCGYDFDDGQNSNATGNPKNKPEDPKLVFDVTGKAIDFMKKQVKAEKPFFMQVCHYADHLAFRGTPEMVKKYKNLKPGERHTNPVFAAMNEDLDRGVGMLLDTIDELGITENTYVFYTADNGYDEGHNLKREKSAWPLSLSKGFVYEGGVRVPFIVRGPGIKPNSVSRVPVIGYDLLPTFLEIVNPEAKAPEVTEGGSLLPLLKNGGKGTVARDNDFFVFHYPAGRWPSQVSLRSGDHKLVKTWKTGKRKLYHLTDDISELKDISAEQPELTTQLDKKLMDYLRSVDAIIPEKK